MKAYDVSDAGNDSPMAAYIRESTDSGDVLHVFGEVDLSNVRDLEESLERLADHDRVIVDLTPCTYMDSSGLRALAHIHKKVEDRLRVVVPQSGSVHRLFEITGLAAHFNACETIEEAFAPALDQQPR